MVSKPPAPRKRATSRKTNLRSVPPAEEVPPAPPEPPKPQTLAEAIEAGDYLGILRAQRRELVTDLRNASGPAKAAMHRQFALLSKEIAALEEEAAAVAKEDGEAGGGGSEDADEAFDPEAL